VDTSAADESVVTDTLGRRTGPRRQYSVEEKRRIVQETRVKGSSVSSVARRYELNANQVFAWRQLYRRGLLNPEATSQAPEMLPVRVSTPTVLPNKPAAPAGKASGLERTSRLIEIKLANGHSVVLRGRVDSKTLSRVLDMLVRR
jgi:transposase